MLDLVNNICVNRFANLNITLLPKNSSLNNSQFISSNGQELYIYNGGNGRNGSLICNCHNGTRFLINLNSCECICNNGWSSRTSNQYINNWEWCTQNNELLHTSEKTTSSSSSTTQNLLIALFVFLTCKFVC